MKCFPVGINERRKIGKIIMMCKRFIGLLMSSFVFFSFVGCNGSDKKTDGSSDIINGVKYERILGTQAKKNIAAGEKISYSVNTDIFDKNYIRLQLKTDVRLFGEFVYSDINDSTKIVREEFYIDASNGEEEIEFKQFLDAYRSNAIGDFEKRLQEIAFTNKSEKNGNIALLGVFISDREFPEEEREIYISDENIKLGADLAIGGALTYLERVSYLAEDGVRYSIDEIVDENDNVYIGVNANKKAKKELSSSVNLLNIWDLGRQFQQSYYADIGGTPTDPNGANGYQRAYCNTAGNGYYWGYNPVQGGDCAYNPSQIIDYSMSENVIYVKNRPMDWPKGDQGKGFGGTVLGGVTTNSYMESTYTIQKGMVFVENSFIDWTGFTELEETNLCSNELPAAYIAHPLRNYVCYIGDSTWTNDEVTVKNDLGYWGDSNIDTKHLEDWFALVNDEMFGVGIYVPNMTHFVSGSLVNNSSSKTNSNVGAFNSPLLMHMGNNKREPSSSLTSCYVYNTNYTAPVQYWRLKSYEKRSYSYAICVDYVQEMRDNFHDIYREGKLTNESLSTWDD